MIREELTGNNDVGGSWYSLDGQRGTLCHAIILGTTGFRKPKGYRDRLLAKISVRFAFSRNQNAIDAS
jgi:hypothetical protein